MKKYLVALGIGSLLVLSACNGEGEESSSDEAEAEENDGDEDEGNGENEEETEMHDIDFEPQSGMRDDSIIVEGETNFMDGTEIEYRVAGVNNTGDEKEGSVIVEDGWFDQDIDVSGFSDDEVGVTLGYFSESQSDDVQEKYGQNGEYIENDDIMQGEIIFEDFYTLPASSAEDAIDEDDTAEIVEGEPMEIDDYTLTVQDYRLGSSYDGEDALVIEYDWVNDSDENASPHMTFSFTAYQDGVETERVSMVEDVDLGTGQRDVQPGGEIEGAETVVGIEYMDEELELELDVLISFDSDPYTTTIDLDDIE
ncbi:DUF5067 domain-containing protein [Salicibibacter halophilus]|uniref:DUF5067 domain-containing protein n=1 Tax=Salicibibacter halophilus TaxID=2502791 RepID=A0A514LFR7_9BACI|nr:DUF5067 domain-containing protein [Salicibibacter halophilus]QDI90702.1 DUF5067 domain-containing protein [Salicibibacter halophilus]